MICINGQPASYSHWCNTGMIVLEQLTMFWLDLMSAPKKGTHAYQSKSGPEPMVGELAGLNLLWLFCLNGCSITLPYKFISLYPIFLTQSLGREGSKLILQTQLTTLGECTHGLLTQAISKLKYSRLEWKLYCDTMGTIGWVPIIWHYEDKKFDLFQ